MKRSSCLSAILVGVSVVTASVAFAAPTPVMVAQAKGQEIKTVQPSDPTPAGGGADPTAAPTTPAPSAEPSTEPTGENPPQAITLGSASGAPGTDSPNASATEPAKPSAKRRWAGTQIFAATSMSTATVFRGQQQDYNPTVDGAIYLQPRFSLNDSFQLRGRVVFNYEFTNSDETVTKNEPRFSDTTISLFYKKIPELPGGIKPGASLNVGLPTSPESRARTLIFNPGVSVQLSKTIEHLPGNGSLDLLASGGYSHPIYRYQTPEVRTSAPYAFQCAGGTGCGDQLSGTFNTSDTISYTMLVSATWGKWSPALYYLARASGRTPAKRSSSTAARSRPPTASAPRTSVRPRTSAPGSTTRPTRGSPPRSVTRSLAPLSPRTARAATPLRSLPGSARLPRRELQHRQHHEAARGRPCRGRYRPRAEQEADRPVLIAL